MKLDSKTLEAVIAIDGPAASGKSTVGWILANSLGYLMIDTGCMYRAVTLAALKRRVSIEDEVAISRVAQEIEIEILPPGAADDGRMYTVNVDGVDVTWELRSPDVDTNVSLVSSYKEVRSEMVRQQRAFAESGRVVMVGRDIGTVVTPDAPLKLFITASAEERARRRWEDRQAQGHTNAYEIILEDVLRRDKIDSSRQISPLRPADDAIVIDTTDRTPEEIVQHILALRVS